MNDFEKWMRELTEIRDDLEEYSDSQTILAVCSGRLTNVILEMSEDYYGEPKNGVYDES